MRRGRRRGCRDRRRDSWSSIRSASTWCGLGGRFRRGSRRRGVQGDQPQRRLGLRLRIELLASEREARHLQPQRHPRAPAAAARMARARTARRRLPSGTEMRRRVAADRRHRGGGLRRGLARPEGLQRGRDPGARATRPSCAGSAFPAIPTTATAAISRPRSTASSSPRSICPTAIRSAPRNSTTNCDGWSGWKRMPRELLAERAAGGAGRRLQRRSRGPRRLLGQGHGSTTR